MPFQGFTPGGGSGGGGATEVMTGNYADRPSTPTAALVFIAKDRNRMYVWDIVLAAWLDLGPIRRLYSPPLANTWTLFNSTNLVIDDSRGDLRLAHESVAVVDDVKLAVKTVPATPYTIEAEISLRYWYAGNNEAGLAWRGSDGKLHLWRVYNVSGGPLTLYSSRFSSATSFLSHYATVPAQYATGSMLRLRLRDDGTNRYVGYALDEGDYSELAAVAHNEYFVPTQVGLYVNARGGHVSMRCRSWRES